MPFRRMFFPNALLEDALLLGAIVGINMAQGLLRLLLGIAFISARIAAAFFVPCYAVNL